MSLDSVLSTLAERGLHLEVTPEGKGFLRGPKKEITDGVRAVLEAYAEEIKERLRPKCTRRIVLVETGEVLEQYMGNEVKDHERTREQAARHPGQTVACEWLSQRPHAADEWHRFLTLVPRAADATADA